ncbi:MBL fold metallo-hydrolase [Thermotoga caldifontis]|uniref:MBL fold metallo-hydrolase n=1 Tax=Thermotoga caldifontis TaxID=1508419 RepID=UPI001E5F70E1|nr:MBL fold metallo-hydrolase [Thermotoga caldifontis]
MLYIIAEVRNVQIFQVNDTIQCVVTGPIGTNSYIIWTHPVLVIDPGYGTGSIVREPCVVLLTHGHFDHVCGLKELECERVYVSEPDSKWLKDPHLNLSVYFDEDFVFDSQVELLKEGSFEIAGLKFQIHLTPGHTPGSMMLRTDGVIFSGDTIFLDSVGRTDLPGGDEKTMRRTLRQIRELLKNLEPNTLLLPGHGEFGTVEEVLKQNIFLREEGS